MSMAPSSLWTEAGPPGDLALVWIVVVGDNHTRIVFLVIIVDVTAAAVAVERISLVRVVRHEDGGSAVAVTIAKTYSTRTRPIARLLARDTPVQK